MNIFTIFFLQNFSKIFSKMHQIAPFLKIFSERMPPNLPSKSAWRIPPLFQKYFEPPRIKILDTPCTAGPCNIHQFSARYGCVRLWGQCNCLNWRAVRLLKEKVG